MRLASVGAGMPSGLNCGPPLRSSDLLPLGALPAHLGALKGVSLAGEAG
jgi:hypothetical protein